MTVADRTQSGPRVVGAKQTRRALADGRAVRVFLAEDADPGVTDPVEVLCAEHGLPCTAHGVVCSFYLSLCKSDHKQGGITFKAAKASNFTTTDAHGGPQAAAQPTEG